MLLSENTLSPKDGNVVVGPLLGANQWNQTQYYNDLCPVDTTGDPAYGGHTPVGCGAVAMGQVMRYWRFPTTGTGSHSYNSDYGTLSANFGSTTYHYENMPDELSTTYHPDSCVEAIATLLYHCGIAVNMYYNPFASGTYSDDIVLAFSLYFRYPTTIHYIERGNLSSAIWLNYMKSELDEGAPFMYAGSGDYNRHIWICDGYQDDDFFHFNWGWGGQENGYCTITNCSSHGFNRNHAITIGIRAPQLTDVIGGNSEKNIRAFSNPTNGIVRMETEGQPVIAVEVFDLFGKMLSHQSVGENVFSVDLSNYNAGTYMLRFITSEATETVKVVKF